MTNQTPNSKIAEILTSGCITSKLFRVKYDAARWQVEVTQQLTDQAATQLQQLIIEERINVWRAILGVDFDQFYPTDKFDDFIKVPSHWINQQISEINMDVKGITDELQSHTGAK